MQTVRCTIEYYIRDHIFLRQKRVETYRISYLMDEVSLTHDPQKGRRVIGHVQNAFIWINFLQTDVA